MSSKVDLRLPVDIDGIPIDVYDMIYWEDEPGYIMKVAVLDYYGCGKDGKPIWTAVGYDDEDSDNLENSRHWSPRETEYILRDLISEYDRIDSTKPDLGKYITELRAKLYD